MEYYLKPVEKVFNNLIIFGRLEERFDHVTENKSLEIGTAWKDRI